MTGQTPAEIRLSKDKKTLTIGYGEGDSHEFPAEMLRVFSPSAEVQGHSPDQRKLVPGKKKVEIMKIEPVGNYAIKITFDDMHDTGIFSWDYFAKLAVNKDVRWTEYLGELGDKGLSR